MAKKRKKHVKRAIVRLYRASSNPPMTISDSAKEAIGKMKKLLRASDSAFLRIDARNKDKSIRELEVYFDDELTHHDMVYLSNKMLFVLDNETAVLCTGSKLRCDGLGFYLETLVGGKDGLSMEDIPQC